MKHLYILLIALLFSACSGVGYNDKEQKGWRIGPWNLKEQTEK